MDEFLWVFRLTELAFVDVGAQSTGCVGAGGADGLSGVVETDRFQRVTGQRRAMLDQLTGTALDCPRYLARTLAYGVDGIPDPAHLLLPP
nr:MULTISPECIES: hypothetical protein [unclassified Streptomyces]